MKPIIILPPDLMKDEDVQELRNNGICVVVASDPGKVRFVDPIPAQSSRTQIENAAIKLSRALLNKSNDYNPRDSVARMYVDILSEGTPIGELGTREEQEQGIIDSAREDELEKIGRQEAREAHAAKKAAQAAAKQTKTT